MQLTPQIRCYTDPSLSALHHGLRASRRRLIVALLTDQILSSNRCLGHLTDSTVTIDVSQLARGIVAIEEDVPMDAATGSLYRSVYTTLIQTHLPELDSLGVIEYESDRKRIHPAQNIIAMATIAAITTPAARLLFNESLSEHDLGGPTSGGESTGN